MRDLDQSADIKLCRLYLPSVIGREHIRDAFKDVSAQKQGELSGVVEDADGIRMRVVAQRGRAGPTLKGRAAAFADDRLDEGADVDDDRDPAAG